MFKVDGHTNERLAIGLGFELEYGDQRAAWQLYEVMEGKQCAECR